MFVFRIELSKFFYAHMQTTEKPLPSCFLLAFCVLANHFLHFTADTTVELNFFHPNFQKKMHRLS